MKKIVFLLLVIFTALINHTHVEAKQDSYTKGNFLFEYEVEDEGTWITKITPLSPKGIKTLNIPKKLGGKKVVKLGAFQDILGATDSPDNDHNLFGVYSSKDDDSIQPPDLQELVKKIKTIQIPDTVKFITQSCFLHMPNAKNINIPKALAEEPISRNDNSFKNSMIDLFTRVKWNKITTSPENKKFKTENGCLLSRDGQILYGFVQKKKCIKIPETVKRIAGFWGDYNGADTIIVPKSVTKIEKGGLSARNTATVKIAKGNRRYAVKGDCVYSKISGRLVVGSVKNGTLTVPNGVKKMNFFDRGSRIGILGPTPSKIVIPKSVKKMSYVLSSTAMEAPNKPNKLTVIMKGKQPPKIVESGSFWADYVALYVPKGCRTKYIARLKSIEEGPLWEEPQYKVVEY